MRVNNGFMINGVKDVQYAIPGFSGYSIYYTEDGMYGVISSKRTQLTEILPNSSHCFNLYSDRGERTYFTQSDLELVYKQGRDSDKFSEKGKSVVTEPKKSDLFALFNSDFEIIDSEIAETEILDTLSEHGYEDGIYYVVRMSNFKKIEVETKLVFKL